MKRHPVATVTSGVAFLALICFGIVASLIVLEKERETKAERMKGEAETDVKRLADLEREVEQLWPASPDKIEALTRWVNEAEALLGRLEVHRSNLAALRERARSPEVEMEDPGNLEGEVVEGETARRRTWKLEDPRDQRWHDTLTELVPALELFESEEGGALHKIRSRLGFARSIEKRSIHDHRAAWDRAIASITDREACPYYKGLTLAPLVGFVPIDRDPKTGFWEFVHLQTGEIPERWNDGRIVLTEETGLIFVLIPGGTFIKGTEQSTSRRFEDSPYLDPGMVRNERPARRVNVQPFLMSKYEMTQGQWLRFTGQNPSCYNPDRSNPIWNKHGGPISLLYPVEQVSWADCAEVLSRMNLRLPSESEWEYACRAGSTTLWWTGDEAVSLEGTANLCDLYYKNHGNVPTGVFEEWLNDGFVVTAPVGSFRANPFGLHDVCGNVWEWCQDAYGTYDSTPVDGSSFEPPDARRRICRGGSFFNGAGCCRSAVREYYDQKIGNLSAGLRPACSIVKNGGR